EGGGEFELGDGIEHINRAVAEDFIGVEGELDVVSDPGAEVEAHVLHIEVGSGVTVRCAVLDHFRHHTYAGADADRGRAYLDGGARLCRQSQHGSSDGTGQA